METRPEIDEGKIKEREGKATRQSIGGKRRGVVEGRKMPWMPFQEWSALQLEQDFAKAKEKKEQKQVTKHKKG